jgi:hypothetical protein
MRMSFSKNSDLLEAIRQYRSTQISTLPGNLSFKKLNFVQAILCPRGYRVQHWPDQHRWLRLLWQVKENFGYSGLQWQFILFNTCIWSILVQSVGSLKIGEYSPNCSYVQKLTFECNIHMYIYELCISHASTKLFRVAHFYHHASIDLYTAAVTISQHLFNTPGTSFFFTFLLYLYPAWLLEVQPYLFNIFYFGEVVCTSVGAYFYLDSYTLYKTKKKSLLLLTLCFWKGTYAA